MRLSKLRAILFLVLLMLLILSGSRFAHYLVYQGYFAGSFDVIEILPKAVKFDLMTTCYVMILPCLLILTPAKARLASVLKVSGLQLGFVLLLLSSLALMGNFIYFGVVNRHTFNDLPLLMSETAFVIPFLLKDYKMLTIFGFVLIMTAVILWLKRWRDIFYVAQPCKSLLSQCCVFLLTIPILFLGLRGLDLQGKPLGIIDAYGSQNEQQANLILNGLFTGAKGTMLSFQRADYQFFTPEQIAATNHKSVQQVYEFPFVQKFTDNKPNGRNLVIILVEALSYAYVDGLAGTNYKATPFLDELSKKSEVYDNFYAAGQRSYLGIQASLFGLPPLNSVGYIGGGLELSRLTKIGHIAQAHGYQTQMLQSSKRDSIRLDAIADYAGFQQYLGLSDIPVTRTDYPDPTGAEFGWDYEMLMKTLELANNSNKPFISFSFTGTTHMPYVETPKHLQVYPYGQDKFTDFLNTLRYTDDALRAFFEAASKQPWYENTTFMILADHTLFNAKDTSIKGAFHIPLWIYRPGQNIKPQRHAMLASQLDILPTAFDLLGFNDEFSAVGSSLYRERKPYSIVVKGDLLGAVTAFDHFCIAGKNIMSDSENAQFVYKQAPLLAEKLKLELQLSQQAVLNNTWAK